MIEPSPQVPLSIEPIVGWRVWRLRRVGGVLRLISLTRDDRWPAGEPMRATCTRHSGGRVPNAGCTCGIYAADSPAALAAALAFSGETCVVGAVAMWGTVVEHATGARSEVAYPARLRLVCSVCLHGGMGGIEPAVVVESASVLRALCRQHGARQPGTSRPAGLVQQELLSAYGVEVLPLERVAHTLRRPRFRRPTIRRPAGPADVLRGAVRGVFATMGFLIQAYIVLSLLLAVATIGFAVIGNVIQVFVHADPSPARAGPGASAPTVGSLAALPRSEDLQPRLVSVPPPPFRVAAVCGDPAGGSIRIVRCGGGHGVLLGLAQGGRPHGAESDCAGVWDVYSRGHDYSICWIALPGEKGIRPHLSSDPPFERMHRTAS